MKARLGLAAVIAVALIAFGGTALAYASRTAFRPVPLEQGNIVITDNPAPDYTFGDQLTFQISAQSEARIKTVNLFYRSAPGAATNLGKPRFIPGSLITATYTISLITNPLPAYTTLEYWWEIEDIAANTLTTEPQTFLYADNRFEWRTLSREPITVHWYQGDTAFGQSAVDVAYAALTDANRDLEAPLPDVVNVYIYASQGDAQEAFKSTGRIWVGAHANPILGVVIVAVSPDGLDADINLGTDIPHELTHVLIYQLTGENYRHVPTWLNEGIATLNQAQPNPNFPQVLKDAKQAGTLFKLEMLCGPFPPDPSEAERAYAQSESVVRYLREEFGASKIRAMLSAYGDGVGCEAGVQQALGISLTELESGWLRKSINSNPTVVRLRSLTPWLGLALLILFAGGLFLLLSLRPVKAPG